MNLSRVAVWGQVNLKQSLPPDGRRKQSMMRCRKTWSLWREHEGRGNWVWSHGPLSGGLKSQLGHYSTSRSKIRYTDFQKHQLYFPIINVTFRRLKNLLHQSLMVLMQTQREACPSIQGPWEIHDRRLEWGGVARLSGLRAEWFGGDNRLLFNSISPSIAISHSLCHAIVPIGIPMDDYIIISDRCSIRRNYLQGSLIKAVSPFSGLEGHGYNRETDPLKRPKHSTWRHCTHLTKLVTPMKKKGSNEVFWGASNVFRPCRKKQQL